MPSRLRSIIDSFSRRGRGRGVSSWWRSLRRSPPTAATNTPQSVSPSSGVSDTQTDNRARAPLPSPSPPSPLTHTDSSQELTSNQTLPRRACDTDRPDRGELPRGDQEPYVHSEDIPTLEDLPPLSFPTPEPHMPESFPHNVTSLSAQAADAAAISLQDIPTSIDPTASETDARSNLLLPIIVIGIQALAAGRDSFNSPHGHDPLHLHHLHQHDHTHNRTDDQDTVLDLDGFAYSFTFPLAPNSGSSHPRLPGQLQPSQEFLLEDQVQVQQDHPSRPRSWQDRFRNLGRSRRNQLSAADPSSTDSGLRRTILIYVIGGTCTGLSLVMSGGER